MPLDVVRLFSSDFHTTATDAQWWAGVTLWGKSWHQVPAASLPDDDTALAHLAELGRDGKAWRKVKAKALHGWVKASDGRLYHRVVAEKALEAWIEKLGMRKSSGAGNAKRWGGEFDPAELNGAIRAAARMLAALNPQSRTLQKRAANTAGGNPTGIPTETPGTVPSGSQETGTGTETKKKSSVLRTAADAANEDARNGTTPPSRPYDDKTWLFRDGLTWLARATGRDEKGLRPQLGRWLRDVKEDTAALRAIFEAAQDKNVADPVSWINAAIITRAKAAALFEPTDDYGWRQRFEAYRANQAWPAKWGGTRPGDDPRHPAHILEESGFRKDAA
jgi:hypothetical protein